MRAGDQRTGGVLFREESSADNACRSIARLMPIRANNIGPRSSEASISI